MESIYLVENKITKEVYVGHSKNPKQRMKDHKCNAYHRNKKTIFYDAIRKYGWENFEMKILELVPEEQALNKEKEYIKKYNAITKGYNIKECEYSKAREPQNVIDVIERYKNGETIKVIAKDYKADRKTISAILKENNIDIRDWNKIQSNPLISKEFLYKCLYIDKKTIKQISEEVNLSKTAIRNWIKKYQLPLPTAM